jgi:hypothetical protein
MATPKPSAVQPDPTDSEPTAAQLASAVEGDVRDAANAPAAKTPPAGDLAGIDSRCVVLCFAINPSPFVVARQR